jgi:hypothetical protein
MRGGPFGKITNYKIQITNKSQIQNYKLQKEEVPYGPGVYTCGEALVGLSPGGSSVGVEGK